MRPASLVLLTSGVGLLLGSAAVASVKIPCRLEPHSITVSSLNQIYLIKCNVWGQPLRAVGMSVIRADADKRDVGTIMEEGPYPNGVRQGKWSRVTYETGGKPGVVSDIWYLDGHEVSAAEWEQRQAER